MICTKCNSEIPNGAKFCPVCGYACGLASDVKPITAPPEPEKKTFCGKCGLELRQGAKFCSVCGAPAANVGDIRPNANSGAVFGNGNMSAVSLDKPGASDNLVAAMNTAAPSSVPMPSSSVPMPSNDVGSGFSSGFSSPAPAFIPESPVAPAASAAPVAPAADSLFGTDNPFGDMGAAAIVATPIKKKSNAAKIGIIIGAAVAVLIVAAAVFFFTNKATALSLIMGKAKYAAMVEGGSIKDATKKLDLPAFSDGIKSASGFAGSMYSAYSALNDVDESFGGFADDDFGLGLSNNSGTSGVSTSVSMEHTYNPFLGASEGSVGVVPNDVSIEHAYKPVAGASEGLVGVVPTMSYMSGDVDLGSLISAYHKAITEVYGMNSVNASLSVKVELADSVKNLIGEDIDEILEIVNNTTFSTSVSTAEDKIAAAMDVKNGSDVINLKTVFNSDGEVYLVLPFVSDQALKVKIATVDYGSVDLDEIAPLELDPKEIERLIGELVEIYLTEYADCAIEMESGELSAAGLTATGKLITAEFSGDDLSDLFAKLAEHFADDEYFRTKIVDFVNECGGDITAQDYKDEIMDAFDFDADDSDKLIISTVIDNGGKILAKSYKVCADDETVELTYVDSKDQFTMEISDDGMTVVALVHDITSSREGSVTVKCTDGDDGSVTVSLKYSDVDMAKFCGNDMITGHFAISVELPADFTSGSSAADLGALAGIKLTYDISVSGSNTMENTFGVEVGNYGSVTFKSNVTVENNDSNFSITGDVIDLGDMESQPDDATMKKLEEYIKTLGEKINSMQDGPFGSLLEGVNLLDDLDFDDAAIDSVITNPGNNEPAGDGSTGNNNPAADGLVAYDMIVKLLQSITDTTTNISEYASTYNVDDAALNKRSSDLINDLLDLYSDVLSKSGYMTSAEFQAFSGRYGSLVGQSEALKRDYETKKSASPAANSNTPAQSNDDSGAASLNYDKMTDDELVDVLDEYETRFLALFTEDTLTKIFSDPQLEALYNTTDDAYYKVIDDFDQFTSAYLDGSYNVGLLRNLRSSTKAFAVAVEALEKAVQVQI